MRSSSGRYGWLIPLAFLPIGAAPERQDGIDAALQSITADRLLGHIKVLSADEYEGRGPGTAGEDLTVKYLIGQFREMGLKPGNPDGSYVQKVPLAGFQATSVQGSFQAGGKTIALNFPTNFVAVSRGNLPKVEVENSDVVFVGYGVVAQEYGWDDYKGVDVRGKTLVMLVNDPAVPDPKDPSQLDPAVFRGRAMTYYGRWTYKYEIASEKGAAAVVLVHEHGPAGYPFEVVQGSWSRENFDIAEPQSGKSLYRVAVEGWIDFPTAKALCAASGQDLSALKNAAVRRDFHPVSLQAKAGFSVANRHRVVQSQNVAAKLEGSDPALKDQYVVYTAHWDHLGRDPKLSGDQIYNGAIDNASGVATVLEIARAFTRIQPAPKRSILFLAVTAEEKGLLGSKYYATHPLYPLERTVANINIDGVNFWGKTSDVISIGMGQSSLDDLLVDVARSRGRTVGPDAEPEKGYYYRSDHFEFAKQGVPALDPDAGQKSIGKPADYARKKRDEYTEKYYHKVSDEIKQDWDLSGAVEDARLLLEVGDRVANAEQIPHWKPDSEFRARREAMLKAAKP
jgi:Zn-dependent M28 family amino/carboxypeptidase